jgi:xanthosine utilization system XapX-like protein
MSPAPTNIALPAGAGALIGNVVSPAVAPFGSAVARGALSEQIAATVTAEIRERPTNRISTRYPGIESVELIDQ